MMDDKLNKNCALTPPGATCGTHSNSELEEENLHITQVAQLITMELD